MRLNRWIENVVHKLRGDMPSVKRTRSSRTVEQLEGRLLLSVTGSANRLALPQWFEQLPISQATTPSGIGGQSTPSGSAGLVYQREFLVRLTDAATAVAGSVAGSQALLANSFVSLQVAAGLGLPGQLLVRTAERDTVKVVAALQSNPNVAHFEENYSVGAAAQVFPNEQAQSQFFTKQYGLHNTGQDGGVTDADIDAPEAWSITTGNARVVVSVIDSGVDFTHPDLYLNIWLNQAEIPSLLRAQLADTNTDGLITFRDLNAPANAAFVRDLNGTSYIDAGDLLDDPLWSDGVDTDGNGFEDDLVGWDFRDNDNRPFDEHRHGTHVAGILGATGNNGMGVVGVSWTTSIMPLRFLDQNNSGDVSDAIEAINYTTLMRTREASPVNIRVSNNSWGSSSALSQNLFDAVDGNRAADILFVAAAGNGDVLGRGIDNDQQPFYPANLDLPNVISVAAFGPDGALARFSNFGDSSVDIAAPGIGITSTEPGGLYSSRNGTSMATPFVSGTAALIFATHPQATAFEVRDAVLAGAEHVSGFDNSIVGGRRLNAGGALAASTFAPVPTLFSTTNISTEGQPTVIVTIDYADDEGVSLSSINVADLELTRKGFSTTLLKPSSVSTSSITGGVRASYQFTAPGGSWDATDNGEYRIQLREGEVRDLNGAFSAPRRVGTFNVALSNSNVFFVNTTVDSVDANLANGIPADSAGRVSLRAAVMQANTRNVPVTIVVPDGVYALTIPGANENLAVTGDLDIASSKEVTIIGGGALTTTIDAQGLDRVFQALSFSTVSIRSLGIVNGRADIGGGVRNTEATLELDSVLVARNVATVQGGGVYSNGELTVRGSSIEYNQTTDRLTPFGGGGIATEFMATIENSSITNNVSAAGFFFSGGGGGGVLNTNTVTIRDTTISANTATLGSGGGLLTLDNSTVVLDHVTIVDNHADNNTGGGLEVRVFNGGPVATTITNSIVARNSANTSDDVYGPVISLGHNLFGQPSAFDPAGWRTVGTGAIDFDLIGTVAQPLDPQLGALVKLDGVRSVHIPLPGSLTIDNGAYGGAVDADQFENPRPVDAGGVTAGTSAVVNTGSISSFAAQGFSFAGNYYFGAVDGGVGRLYRLNQTSRAIEQVGQFDSGQSIPYEFEVLNGALYFFVSMTGTTTRQLWSYTGSGSPTLRAQMSATSLSDRPRSLTAFDAKLYFGASRSDVGDELFVFNPQSNLISLAANLSSGTVSSFPTELTVFNSELYFIANDDLYRFNTSNGSPTATSTSYLSSLQRLAVAGNTLFVAAGSPAPTLHIYDHILDYAFSIAQFVEDDFTVSTSTTYAAVDGKLFFPADDPRKGIGEELYFYDPEGAPFIQLAADVFPGPQGASIRNLTSDGERVFFTARTAQGSATGQSAGMSTEELVVFDPATSLARVGRGATNINSTITISGGEAFYVGARRGESSSRLWSFPTGSNGATDMGAVEVTTGRISGVSYHDANGNGRRDPDEPGLGGQVMFDDLNSNGRRDTNEPQTVSRFDDLLTSEDETGQFSFEPQAVGSHLIRQAPSDGFRATSPRRFLNTAPTLQQLATTPAGVVSSDRLLTPSVVGDQVVYLDRAQSTLWGLISGGAAVALANAQSDVPGTNATIQSFATAPAQDGQEVAFAVVLSDGSEAVLIVDRDKRVRVIANTNTALPPTFPTSGMFTSFGVQDDVPDSIGISNGIVAFYGVSNTSVGFFAGDGSSFASIQPSILDQNRFTQVDVDVGRAILLLDPQPDETDGHQNFYLYEGLLRLRVGDEQRPVPEGTGNFERALDFSVSNGRVAFRSLGEDGQDGIYVGAGVDRNRVVANKQTMIPGGTGTFTSFGSNTNNLSSPSVSIDNENVVFIGRGSGGQIGIYASISGSLRRIVDLTTSFGGLVPVDFDIGHQAISGDSIVFHVNFSNGSEAIYRATLKAEQAADVTVNAGQTSGELEFGSQALPGTIRGVSFTDADGDRFLDPGEPANAGRTVYLDQNRNGSLDSGELSTLTNIAGVFTFANLAALESYVIAEVLPNGVIRTTPSNLQGSTVTLQPAQTVDVTLGSGTGVFDGQAADGKVQGVIFADTNGNGIKDSGEQGIVGVTVFVDENADRVLNGGERSAVTGAGGAYTVDQLRGNRQAVRVVIPAGMKQLNPLGNAFVRSSVQTTDSPVDVAVGDLDRDGDDDMVSSSDFADEVQLFTNSGNGSFGAPVRVNLPSGPGSLAIGKFQGSNQAPGIVVGHRVSNNVTVLTRQGNGSYTSQALVTPAQTATGQPLAALGNAPYFVTTGDFDGDGDDDVAVASQNAAPNGGAIVTFLSNGAGGFTREQILTLPSASVDSPAAITAARVDGDARVDLVVANLLSNNVTILNNTGVAGANRFGISSHIAIGGLSPTNVRVGDLNGDGRMDLATTNIGSNNISVVFAKTTGGYDSAIQFNAARGPADLELIDLDRNGNLDILFTSSDAANRFGILRNRGGGSFQAAEASGLATIPDGTLAFALAIGQFNDDNGDGAISALDIADVAVSNRRDGSVGSASGGITVGLNSIVSGALNVELTVAQRNATGLDFALRSFNQLPTLNVISSPAAIDEDSAQQSLGLSGITDGGDPFAQALRVSVVSSVPGLFAQLGATVASGGNSTVSYTPALNRSGTATITVTVRDSGLDQTLDTSDDGLFSRSFEVTLRPVNDLPVAVSDITSAAFGSGPIEFDVIANDEIANPDLSETLRVLTVTPPAAGGTVMILPDKRRVRYTPPVGATGQHVLHYIMSDGNETAEADLTVSISKADVIINAGNDNIAVQSVSGAVRVLRNGVIDNTASGASSAMVGKIQVTGGTGANLIDLSGVTKAAFTMAGGVVVVADGGAGNDTLIGSEFNDSLTGGADDDQLTGGLGVDTVDGSAGPGDTLIEASAGTLVLTSTKFSITISNVTESDTLSNLERANVSGSTAANKIDLSGFAVGTVTTINGAGGNDTIIGSPAPDMIFTLTGADSIFGNSGTDTVFSGSGNDTISGGDGNDNLNGQNGDDSMLGDAGNDVLTGGAGVDVMQGGLGNDFLSGQTEAGSLFGGEGNDTLQGNTANDTLSGDAGDDRLFGLQGNDIVAGGDGADSLLGAAGDDSLSGGIGADTLQGDVGDDTIDGGAESDRINEILDTNLTIVGLTISTTTMGKDSVVAVERIQVSGGASNNFFDARQASVPVLLAGGGGNDTLLGGSKADGIVGGDGDDVISGGAGVDVIDGGNGSDYWLEAADTNFTVNGVTITSTITGTETAAAVERIVLIGGTGANKLDAIQASVSVVLIGGRGNDTLLGGSQADTLSGGNRNDSTVAGSDGLDSLDGGGGADVLENDSADTKVLGAGDSAIADVFAILPEWIDAL